MLEHNNLRKLENIFRNIQNPFKIVNIVEAYSEQCERKTTKIGIRGVRNTKISILSDCNNVV
jgi:hypothetical protein